jgi:hypothetical protein
MDMEKVWQKATTADTHFPYSARTVILQTNALSADSD